MNDVRLYLHHETEEPALLARARAKMTDEERARADRFVFPRDRALYTIAHALLWTALGPLFLVLWFGYYMPKKQRIEGNRLRKHFGSAYDEYDRAVPAFVPSLRRWPSSSRAPWHWPTFLSNHELGLDVLLVLLFVAMPFAQDWF